MIRERSIDFVSRTSSVAIAEELDPYKYFITILIESTSKQSMFNESISMLLEMEVSGGVAKFYLGWQSRFLHPI